MATPYQNVAKAALINWNGLSEGEANAKIQTESVQELESQVYAMDSMKYAVVGIAKQVGLNEEETTNFFEAVINGPENAEIFVIVDMLPPYFFYFIISIFLFFNTICIQHIF